MKKIMILLAVAAMTITANAQNYGITFGELEVTAENAADIFGDGKVAYDAEQNTLTFQEGLDYHLSKNFVTIATGRDFHIHLEGNAEMSASVNCSDDLFIESVKPYSLKITANISGSALKCPNLTIENDITLNLLSRNSSSDLHALDCAGTLTVNTAILNAEVTTARLAVAVQDMVLNGCWLQKPKGGIINPAEGGICFSDGIPAKQVHIVIEGFGIEENDGLQQDKQVQKIYENGQIVIIKDGKRYNAKGQQLN